MNETVRPIRRAPQNPAFRLPDLEDLVAGAQLYVLYYDATAEEFADPWRLIELVEDPIGEERVYFQWVVPKWDTPYYVSLSEVVYRNQMSDLDRRLASHYWIDMRP